MDYRKRKERTFTGTLDSAPSLRERENRKLAKKAAAEGMVLLKNERNLLPLKSGSAIALYGAGASMTRKGGTGSGDVNERESISIYTGLKNAGFSITTEEWIADYERIYRRKREEWRDGILKKDKDLKTTEFFHVYSTTPFAMPPGGKVTKTEAETAIYVVSRIAGEGADRYDKEGDYRLSKEEKEMLSDICGFYENVVVVINAGGFVELSFLEEYENIHALLYIVQPGMEGGNAFAALLSGQETPSGKLTDTWAYHYEDYPNAKTYSHNNGDVNSERYEEGIYVGYRYFDTFSVPVRYGFGFGLSYTEFEIKAGDVRILEEAGDSPRILVTAEVKNTGNTFSGKEVVQIYVSCPLGKLDKEYRRLAAFAKTKSLAPGESQSLMLTFPVSLLASFDDGEPGWILEPGFYGIFLGNSLEQAGLMAMLSLDGQAILERTEHICPLQEALKELAPERSIIRERERQLTEKAKSENLKILALKADQFKTRTVEYGETQNALHKEAAEFTQGLSTEQLVRLASGDPGKGQGSNLGSAGISVPGSAGETSQCALEQNLASIVLTDGPAGLRLNQSYRVKENKIVPIPFLASLEGGFFYQEKEEEKGRKYYQYCTAIPVGTLLAQTFNTELIRQIGRMIGREMQEFGTTLWLAPGMNIHRNPLCGRNFEYYSEDPYLTGMMASAMTSGVQEEKGCGTTIKHFACNNQEDNRTGSNSIVSERALREIYLKGFELAVKTSQPMSIMTSYNLINGIHAANSYDLCTKAARREWGFAGVIMTDWTTTENGDGCTAAGCIRAGNDLIMPGNVSDYENMKQELEAGTLSLQELKSCIVHLVNVIFRSNQYEDAQSYLKQFEGLSGFLK